MSFRSILAQIRGVYRRWIVVTCFASCALAGLYWLIPRSPVWARAVDPTDTPIGFTDDGQIVILHFNAVNRTALNSPAAPTVIQIVDPQTGQVRNERTIPYQCNQWAVQRNSQAMVIAGDWLVLPCELPTDAGGTQTHLVVVQARTGKLRFPSVPIRNAGGLESPHGRYLIFDVATKPSGWMIVDAESGQLLISVDPRTGLFSSDSRYWIGVNGATLQVQAIESGSLVATIPIPTIDVPSTIFRVERDADRLMVWYDLGKSSRPRYRVISYRFNGKSLTDPTPPRGLLLDDTKPSGDRYVGVPFIQTKLIPRLIFYWTVDWIPSFLSGGELQYNFWTLVDRTSGRCVGKGIVLESHRIVLSPDGKWLVARGTQLRAWKLPTSPWPDRLWSLLAAAIPWVGLLIGRNRYHRLHHPGPRAALPRLPGA